MFKSTFFSNLVGRFLVMEHPAAESVSPREFQPAKSRFRSRIPGPAGKPGDKLARLAARRRVGLSTIR